MNKLKLTSSCLRMTPQVPEHVLSNEYLTSPSYSSVFQVSPLNSPEFKTLEDQESPKTPPLDQYLREMINEELLNAPRRRSGSFYSTIQNETTDKLRRKSKSIFNELNFICVVETDFMSFVDPKYEPQSKFFNSNTTIESLDGQTTEANENIYVENVTLEIRVLMEKASKKIAALFKEYDSKKNKDSRFVLMENVTQQQYRILVEYLLYGKPILTEFYYDEILELNEIAIKYDFEIMKNDCLEALKNV